MQQRIARGEQQQVMSQHGPPRYNAEQALQDTWIKDRAPKAENISLQDRIVHNLKSFRPAVASGGYWQPLGNIGCWTRLPRKCHALLIVPFVIRGSWRRNSA
eukprot:Skav226474  [mRNA]  locus=scaffold4441:53036:53341:- [translate_table: standard]